MNSLLTKFAIFLFTFTVGIASASLWSTHGPTVSQLEDWVVWLIIIIIIIIMILIAAYFGGWLPILIKAIVALFVLLVRVIWAVLKWLWGILKWLWEKALRPLLKWLWEKALRPLLQWLKDKIKWLWEKIGGDALWDGIKIVITIVVGWISGLWKKLFGGGNGEKARYCLYEISESRCQQARWQVGEQLCAACPEDGKCSDNVIIEVWDIPPGTQPTDTSPKGLITLRRLRADCGDCPTGVPIIGVVEPKK